MNMQAAPPQLGSYILVVIDSSPGFFDALQTAVSLLPDIDRTFFTVLCCCPTRYWGHVGDSTPELKRYIDSLLEEEEAEFAQAEHCLGRARAILEDAGAPSDQILTRTSAEDSLLSATMDELKKSQYSGVIVSFSQYDIVNRLLGRGITDIFRHTPEVQVWPVNTEETVMATTLEETED